MGLFLCLVCNLGAICGHFRQVFGSVLFMVLFLHIKWRNRRWMTSDEWVPQIALVSQTNSENCHKNTIFLKPHNFDIQFSLHGDPTLILVWENSKIILLSANFPCTRQSCNHCEGWIGCGNMRPYEYAVSVAILCTALWYESDLWDSLVWIEVTCLPPFYVEKQHCEQHWTKNMPKMATNNAPIITQDTKTTLCRVKWSSFPHS